MFLNSKFQIPNSRFKIQDSEQKGSVLLEMLVVIAIIGIVAGTIGGIFYANQRGNIAGRLQTIEASLVQEALEAVKTIITSNDAISQGWNRLYCPPNAAEPDEGGDCAAAGSKGAPDTNPYQVKVVGNSWKLYQGAETVTIGEETYTRAIHIENVTRDANGQIGSGDDDPFTQKITVKVTPPSGAPPITATSYFTRSITKQTSPSQAPASQTDWSGWRVSDTPTCASTVMSYGNQYCVDDSNADISAGSIKIKSDYFYRDKVLNTSGLVAYWRLGESSGPAVYDATGNGHLGTATGSPTFGSSGLLVNDGDTAVLFAGTQSVTVDDNAAWDLTDFTLEAWVKFTSVATNMRIVSQQSGANYWLMGIDTKKLRIGSSLDTVLAAVGPDLNDGAAHHIAVVRDAGATITSYIDGSQVDQRASSSSASSAIAASVYLASYINTGEYWDGTLDEIAVYNTALTAAQVKEHYVSGK